MLNNKESQSQLELEFRPKQIKFHLNCTICEVKKATNFIHKSKVNLISLSSFIRIPFAALAETKHFSLTTGSHVLHNCNSFIHEVEGKKAVSCSEQEKIQPRCFFIIALQYQLSVLFSASSGEYVNVAVRQFAELIIIKQSSSSSQLWRSCK